MLVNGKEVKGLLNCKNIYKNGERKEKTFESDRRQASCSNTNLSHFKKKRFLNPIVHGVWG